MGIWHHAAWWLVLACLAAAARTGGQAPMRTAHSKPFHFLIVAVPSSQGSRQRRDLLRTQWSRNLALMPTQLQEDVLLRFVLGSKALDAAAAEALRVEGRLQRDIINLPCPDADGELDNPAVWGRNKGTSSTTCKLMKAAQWAVRRFDFSYFMRLGDDSYLRIDKLLPQLVAGVFPDTRAVIGAISRTSPELWPPKQIYMQGRGFLLTPDICQAIAHTVPYLLDTAPEDVIASWWMQAFGAEFIQHPGWREALSNEQCDSDMVLIHKLEIEAWPTITADGLCHREHYVAWSTTATPAPAAGTAAAGAEQAYAGDAHTSDADAALQQAVAATTVVPATKAMP